MHSRQDLPIVESKTVMSETLIVMTSKRFGCVGVVGNDGKLLGIITDGDLRRNLTGELLKRKAEEVMTSDPMTIREDALAAEAVLIMNEKNITGLFVTEGGHPIGILHIHDCLRAGIT